MLTATLANQCCSVHCEMHFVLSGKATFLVGVNYYYYLVCIQIINEYIVTVGIACWMTAN